MKKLKYFRIMADLTLEALADKAEVSVGHLSHLENGSRDNPSKETMEKVAAALGKTVPEVFFSELTEQEAQDMALKGHHVESGVVNQ